MFNSDSSLTFSYSGNAQVTIKNNQLSPVGIRAFSSFQDGDWRITINYFSSPFKHTKYKTANLNSYFLITKQIETIISSRTPGLLGKNPPKDLINCNNSISIVVIVTVFFKCQLISQIG